MQLREIRLKMAAVLKKNAPNSNNKNFFGGRNYFLFFRLENLSLSPFSRIHSPSTGTQSGVIKK
jgi:hypothetical protein